MTPGPYGVLSDEPNPTYHANEAWSNSKVQVFRRSHLEAYQRFVAKTRAAEPSTPALAMGSAVHCATLEGPAAFAEQYVLSPFDSFRTKEAQEWRAAHQLAGRQVLARSEAATVGTCVAAVKSDPLASALLAEGRPEVTFRKRLARFDVQARVDWYNPAGTLIPRGAGAPEPTGSYFLELKTVGTHDQSGVERDIWDAFEHNFKKFSYHMQAAWNREVIAELMPNAGRDQVRPAVYYIVVQTDEPFNCIVCQPSARALATGTVEILRYLRELTACYETGIWNGVYEVGLPYGYEQRVLGQGKARAPELGI